VNPAVRTVVPPLRLGFESNRGRAAPEVRFLSPDGSAAFLAGGHAILTLSDDPVATLHITFVGANPKAEPVEQGGSHGQIHDYPGRDPALWESGFAACDAIVYRDVYDGIDLVYRHSDGQLEYDFVVAPQADLARITIEFQGADWVAIDADGSLVVTCGGVEVRQHLPHVYQDTAAGRRPIPGRYALRGPDRVGFDIGPYEPDLPLVIDPPLTYSSFLGANTTECLGIATDQSGNIFLVGRTSFSVPVANAFQPTASGGGDVFVTKLDPTGTILIYSTYLGGSGQDEGLGIVVDRSGNAYVTGRTSSANFPVTPGAFQTALAGGIDAFVAKLDPKGKLVYSTYLGGSGDDAALDIAVDTTGQACVTGYTASINFPVTGRRRWWWFRRGALQPNFGGGALDAFVTKLNATGSGLVYSTYLGGSGNDQGSGIGLCGDNWVHITGLTDSPNFPTTPNAYQSGLAGAQNAFFAKLNFAGTALVYGTYLGGSGSDQAMDIAVTGDARVYITGFTDSANFPVLNAFQGTLAGGQNAFATHFDRNGNLVYSTYLGGSGSDQGMGIGVDPNGNAYVAGTTTSPNFPQVNPAQPAYGGGPFDAFVAKVDPTGAALVYSTCLGGSDDDRGTDVAVNPLGNAYVTGWTYSPNFPTVSPLQGTPGGSPDVFIAIL
jgi:hypothetical protein